MAQHSFPALRPIETQSMASNIPEGADASQIRAGRPQQARDRSRSPDMSIRKSKRSKTGITTYAIVNRAGEQLVQISDKKAGEAAPDLADQLLREAKLGKSKAELQAYEIRWMGMYFEWQ